MPSPKKRKIRKAIGNIHPAEVLTVAQQTDTFVSTLLSENAHNYAATPGGKSFENGDVVALSAADSDDGLLTAGEQDSTTAMPGRVSLVFGATGPDVDGIIGLTGSAGNTCTFKFREGANAITTTLGTNADPVLVKGNGANETAHGTSFMAALATAMTGTIQAVGATSAGSTYTVILTQAVEGAAGNTAVVDDSTDTTFTNTSFAGGADSIAIGGAIAHYWFDTTNSAATVAAAAVAGVALTASSGIIYDPSGPKSKYISGCETVSSGSAKYVVIRPTAWDASDIISIEVVGDTNTADKLSLLKLEADAATTAAIDATGDFDLSGTEATGSFTNITGTIDHNTSITYATAAAGGFAIKWERDATGLAEADIKKGWYIRWNSTAV